MVKPKTVKPSICSDHEKCVTRAITNLEEYCKENELNFTPIRRKVFEIVLETHKALGAYQILDSLRDIGFDPKPPMAYRALEFLVNTGFVHRVEHLNAFIACARTDEKHNPALMVCRACKTVVEEISNPQMTAINKEVGNSKFQIESSIMEAIGLCKQCS